MNVRLMLIYEPYSYHQHRILLYICGCTTYCPVSTILRRIDIQIICIFSLLVLQSSDSTRLWDIPSLTTSAPDFVDLSVKTDVPTVRTCWEHLSLQIRTDRYDVQPSADDVLFFHKILYGVSGNRVFWYWGEEKEPVWFVPACVRTACRKRDAAIGDWGTRHECW